MDGSRIRVAPDRLCAFPIPLRFLVLIRPVLPSLVEAGAPNALRRLHVRGSCLRVGPSPVLRLASFQVYK